MLHEKLIPLEANIVVHQRDALIVQFKKWKSGNYISNGIQHILKWSTND